MVLGVILMTFGDPGVTFSDFSGSWGQAGNFMIFEGYPGRAQVERTRSDKRSGSFLAPSKQLLNTRLLTCKQLKADTRLVNLPLQTRTGKPDCPLVTEGLEGLGNSD